MKLRNVVFTVMMAITPVAAITVSGCVPGAAKYDTLVDKDEACNQAWADYESALKRRADLIPQLVAVVKGVAGHEASTLIAVTEARASATRPEIKLDPSKGDFENPEKFKQFSAAQDGLGSAMSKLMVANERYPELTANQQFRDLQIQIEGTENRLLRAREQYNKAVKEFNTELRHVSGKIINPLTGREFAPRVYFSVEEKDKETPTIDFGASPAPSK